MKQNDQSSFIGLILIAGIFILGNLFLFNNTEESQVASNSNKERKNIEINNEVNDSEDSSTQKEKENDKKDINGDITIEEKTFVLENDKILLTFSNKKGEIISAKLKNYCTYQEYHISDSLSKLGISYKKKSIEIFNSEDSEFIITGDHGISTDGFFETIQHNYQTISFRKEFNNGSFIEYTYSLDDEQQSFLNLTVNSEGIENPEMLWTIASPKTEKSRITQEQYTGFYYQENDDKDVKYTWDNEKFEINKFKVDLKWIAFKQQFFSTIIKAKDSFSGETEFEVLKNENDKYIKTLSLKSIINSNSKNDYSIYIGTNDYNTLKQYDEGYEEIVPLGYMWVDTLVNKYIVINLFDFLRNNLGIKSCGLIILLLTLIIKFILSPLTYKSYLSQAKMKVLKPEIDKINEKHKGKDPMKVQQETMGLYRKAGVNPLGGCLPMLIQFPILIAMFRFFPVSLDLRQNSFLWADDLSSYDSIYDLGFYIPLYGDHISLFTLLMTISTLIYTHMNSQMTSTQMPGMKVMMYLMPIMFLGFLNNFAASLSYYYFLANVFTFSQMYLMRRFIDDKAILAQLEKNKKKPPKPKSRFQKKLEAMQKKQEEQMKNRKRK